MRTNSLNLVVITVMGLLFVTSCAPEPKNADTTKDSGFYILFTVHLSPPSAQKDSEIKRQTGRR